MAKVIIYSLKKDGDINISKNFKVKEFRSKDGSDVVKVDSDNVAKLQKIRNYFKKAININSGYRTPAHNKAVGSVSNSYHTKGQAADIVISGVDAFKVYLYADIISPANSDGIIYYPNSKFCHIDTRPEKLRAITLDGKSYLCEPTKALKQGNKNLSVKWLQYMLTCAGYTCIVDGYFSSSMTLTVKKFQAKYKLFVDGIFGPKSIAKLKEVLKEKYL